jgi:hypothetical protein
MQKEKETRVVAYFIPYKCNRVSPFSKNIINEHNGGPNPEFISALSETDSSCLSRKRSLRWHYKRSAV